LVAVAAIVKHHVNQPKGNCTKQQKADNTHHLQFLAPRTVGSTLHEFLKQKAARRRLCNSNPMIADQAAINTGFDFRR
jgi:hypothetical protein